MNAPELLSHLRQKNAEISAPSPNCINPVKDFMQFMQFASSAKKSIVSEGKEVSAADTASVWWLLRYLDHKPIEVARSPLATHTETLEQHPDAVAAESIHGGL